jgi:hypothetical protein
MYVVDLAQEKYQRRKHQGWYIQPNMHWTIDLASNVDLVLYSDDTGPCCANRSQFV